jgi:methylphosphotriester-DNA--protein-cysteine methyltransferase
MKITAVVTTGIYCRPGCPARPLPKNVRHFESAEAARAAGFRACNAANRTHRPVRYLYIPHLFLLPHSGYN